MYWMTEALPLAVTAMVPVVLYPLTGVMTCKAVAQQYVNDTNFLFIGGLIVAVAIEKCNLHKRIALFILKLVGSDPKWIMLGLMLGTCSLRSEDLKKSCKEMSTGLALCICYASSIGGTGTLTGTPGNLVLAGQLPELFDSRATLDYVNWFLFSFPLMVFCLAACWGTLVHSEWTVAISFVVLLLLWILRDPGLFPGFGTFLPKKNYTDATSAMIIALLLFALPNDKPDFCDYKKKNAKESPRCMDWPTIQKRFPWDVVLLLGGGFALASGVKDSGLAKMIGGLLSSSSFLPLWVLELVTMSITLGVTNFCSNVATTTIFVPIVATLLSNILESHETMFIFSC
ncbi:sodium:sulfate symporter transmembrane region [Dictyocaulus viviparus]|uniref:Sodium:sulfate symporter transmembrane region n=1 Tax=Dictyocaulus viviparus TaxID=29172 RepID=A0A0D8XV21_DICVI|nr:sodium:sulfate symporter transmembrane region [Dictyocaulus viviparus]